MDDCENGMGGRRDGDYFVVRSLGHGNHHCLTKICFTISVVAPKMCVARVRYIVRKR